MRFQNQRIGIVSLLFTCGTFTLANAGTFTLVWELRTNNGPAPRGTPRLAFDATRGVSVLFGGYDQFGSHFGDTWEWDGTAWTLRSETGPAPRSEHAMAFDQARNETVLFGGNGDNGTQLGDTWEWDGSQWLEKDAGDPQGVSAPAARHGAGLAYDSARGVTVLFGGRTTTSPSDYFGDTWEWDGAHWSLRSVGDPAGIDAPPARAAHAMAYDSDRGVVVVFSGGSGGFPLEDTWEWDGATWIKRCDSCGPLPRGWSQSVYDSARGVTILFGGGYVVNGSPLADTWSWNGDSWMQLQANGPQKGLDIGMCYDSLRSATVLAGGRDYDFEEGTWELHDPDSDGDGVPDTDDDCPNSVLVDEISITSCRTAVDNQLLGGGCTMMDEIAQCQAGASTHGEFVSCVSGLVNGWRTDGLVTGNEGSQIMSCAGRTNKAMKNLIALPSSKG